MTDSTVLLYTLYYYQQKKKVTWYISNHHMQSICSLLYHNHENLTTTFSYIVCLIIFLLITYSTYRSESSNINSKIAYKKSRNKYAHKDDYDIAHYQLFGVAHGLTDPHFEKPPGAQSFLLWFSDIYVLFCYHTLTARVAQVKVVYVSFLQLPLA